MLLNSTLAGTSRMLVSPPIYASPTSELSESEPSSMWFPVNDNISTSWPPKITFDAGRRPRSSSTSLDAMEGVLELHPQSTSDPTRSATRSIPHRTSRSKLLSVPTTPTSLWRQVPLPKGQDLDSLTRELFEAEKCSRATLASGRIRPAPSVDMESEADPSQNGGTARCKTPSQPSHLPWNMQKRRNPHLPLVLSAFNPSNAPGTPPLYWKSINPRTGPFQNVKWNIDRPHRPPTKTRSRKDCDLAGQYLPREAVYRGKLRHHCRICGKDSLLKRLLLVRHWASMAYAMYKSISTLPLPVPVPDDDAEMGDAAWDSFPRDVLLRELDDFDDDEGSMYDDPLIVEQDSEGSSSLSLF
ncbi:hypothetical protein DFH06DRAFT_1319657 [Mycena polygramma]|nr:hypothetical protein DFH06DRAFT_116966 [Mycena polygramma]KAJ7672230.1 hypothetical protein DFH06DRAFT_1319657 [Mycena polygramma]